MALLTQELPYWVRKATTSDIHPYSDRHVGLDCGILWVSYVGLQVCSIITSAVYTGNV